jgi:hypothetical protein
MDRWSSHTLLFHSWNAAPLSGPIYQFAGLFGISQSKWLARVLEMGTAW